MLQREDRISDEELAGISSFITLLTSENSRAAEFGLLSKGYTAE